MPLSFTESTRTVPQARDGYTVVAQKLREAAGGDLSSSDTRARLGDAIQDQHKGTGHWASYIDHFGDGESGDVVYSCDNDVKKAPYSISGGPGAARCTIDFDGAVDVVPRTVYEEEADEDDHYSAMSEAFKRQKIYKALPLYERFISKGERDNAESADFAGKNRSFPILKASDVSAAFHALGRAGDDNFSVATIRANIIRIAKKKGFTLPKSAQESAAPAAGGQLRLVESHDWSQRELRLIESSDSPAQMKIKLIAPGKGTSAFYPAEVLKRDGPRVFTKGTHIYINHATAAEEAARPEGDWHKLAGALNGNAYWDESAKDGPGLYGDALFTSDYAPLIKEKAAFTGMSIRACGDALKEAGKITTREGVPVLASLTSAESVDIVTRAGAGGMILTEGAPAPNSNQGGDMTEAEVKRLIEVERATDRANAARSRLAVLEASRVLQTMSLPEISKRKIVESVCGGELPVQADGTLDVQKLTESVNAAAKTEGEYLAEATGSGRVVGMGASVVPISEGRKPEEIAAEQKRLRESAVDTFASLMGGDRKAAEAAVSKRGAA